MSIIEVKNLKKHYTTYDKEYGLMASFVTLFKRNYYTVKAVDGVSFSLNKGELVGFIGPNGAGKTTVLKCLSGIIEPTSGKVSVLGFRPGERAAEYKEKIGFVTGQKNQLFWDLPPMETFYLNKSIYKIDPAVFQKNLKYLTELLLVKDIIKTPSRKLSLGERMKCELIAALLHDPEVLFLDEPTIGLDVVAQKNIQDFIKTYNQEKQATIILTSHSMQDVKRLCERIVIIDKGLIRFDGKLHEIIQNYEETKRITITLTDKVSEETLYSFKVPVLEYTFPLITYSVGRNEIAAICEQLLKKLPVADLNIEEVPLEEAIGNLFSEKQEEELR